MKQVSGKAVERISLYRRLLSTVKAEGRESVYSHELGEMIGCTAAQVRRDLMEVGFSGNSKKGYDVDGLIEQIGAFLDSADSEPVALIGVGNLGRALLPFFSSHHSRLKIEVSFDADPQKAGRVIHGCRCHDIADLKDILEEKKIRLAVMAVPTEAAQSTSDQLVQAGIRGILNFVPEPLKVPTGITVENIDMTMALEKVAFMARGEQND